VLLLARVGFKVCERHLFSYRNWLRDQQVIVLAQRLV
jgi:hypothetical protein